jgi:hypothetical protein
MGHRNQLEDLERVVLDYIERYGLSDLARAYFCDQPAPTGKCRQDVERPS